MAKASACKRNDGKIFGYAVFCPGCRHPHVFNVQIEGEAVSRPCWTFNGDMESPTFAPSMLTWTGEKDGQRQNVCHSFVTAGRIQFLSDTSAHSLGDWHDLPEFQW